MEKALRHAALALVTLSCIALALSTGIVGSTFALFNGETQNTASTFAGGWIGAPTGPTARASGYDMSLAWTAGAHGPITGQTLNGVDNNTSSNCTGAAYSLISSGLTATATTYTDSSRGNGTNNGHWFCYQLVSTTSPLLWTASTAFGAVQLGLVTTGISIANVGANNSVNANDTITLTFNQQTNLAASGTTKVCVVNSGSNDRVIIGDTAGGNSCAVGDGYTVGLITGVTISGNQVYRNSTYTTTNTSPYTMTITLVGGGTATYSGTSTFTPSSSILSSVTTHQATMCTTATICRPTTTTHF